MRISLNFKEDHLIIEKQIGRRPRGEFWVEKRCLKNSPVVILTYPVRGKELFPTLYYLTCPHLVKEVSQLEGSGLVRELQDRLASDEAFQKDFHDAQSHYRGKRFSLLVPEEESMIGQNKVRIIKESGIAGAKNLTRIKCLHAHYAHFLALGRNPVGEIVQKKLKPAINCTKDYGL